MRRKIGIQFIAAVGVITVAAMLVFASILLKAQERQLLGSKITAANQLSETIKKSTRQDMLINRLDNVYLIIKTIGEQPGIERVRIIEKSGQIVYSTRETEIGGKLDLKAEACYVCHATNMPLEQVDVPRRTRVYRDTENRHILGIINPIYNEASCSTSECHYHPPGKRVLGVLDITMSLGDVDKELGEMRRATLGAVLIAVLLISFLIYWFINRKLLLPLREIVYAFKEVAAGKLDTRLEKSQPDEIGQLMDSFNEMARKLSEAQMQISQSDKLASVGRLAAGVAHEINNPLTGVLTYSSFMLKRSDQYPELKEDLEVIVRETKRCREIVKGLLDFSRQSTFKKSDANLNEVMERAIEVVSKQISLKNITVEKSFEENLPIVCIDPNQIQQVVVNLLVNASDAMPGGGVITTSTKSVRVPPRGNAQIRAAFCPEGCQLTDDRTRIRNMPAITVNFKDDLGKGVVHLDPVYGGTNHVFSRDVRPKSILNVNCPKCEASLLKDGGKCPLCSAPLFFVRSHRGSEAYWCTRRGCPYSIWEEVDAGGEREYVEFAVADEGVGMPSDLIKSLFEPFFTTKGTKGTGLGLAVSWGIIRNHGGTIQVESDEGKGSVFTVRLPVEVTDAE